VTAESRILQAKLVEATAALTESKAEVARLGARVDALETAARAAVPVLPVAVPAPPARPPR
jgi:hypothetical protein